MSAWARARLMGGAAAIRMAGLPALARRRYGWFPTVVTYHGVHDGSASSDIYHFSSKHVGKTDFRRQLEWLDQRYELVSLAEVENVVRSGAWRRNLAAVTFDDGYENNLTVAAPILKELRIPATFFITVNVVETQTPYDHDRIELAFRCAKPCRIDLSADGVQRSFELGSAESRAAAVYGFKAWFATLPGPSAARVLESLLAQCGTGRTAPDRMLYQPLTWPQVRTLADEGFEIGSHTLSHPHLAQAVDDRVRTELTDSRRILEERIGRPVRRISYPYGSHDGRTMRMAAEAGYASAYTTRPWSDATREPMAIPRISVTAGQSFHLFVASISRALLLIGRGGGHRDDD